LALAALVPGRRGRFPQERLAAGVLMGCLLLLAQPPGFENLAARLPVIGATSSWLAACEAGRWRRGEGKRIVISVVAAGLTGLIAWAYLTQPPPATASAHPISWMATQLAALALGLGLLFVARRERRP